MGILSLEGDFVHQTDHSEQDGIFENAKTIFTIFPNSTNIQSVTLKSERIFKPIKNNVKGFLGGGRFLALNLIIPKIKKYLKNARFL